MTAHSSYTRNQGTPPNERNERNERNAPRSPLLEEALWLVHVEGGDRVVGPVSAQQIAWGIRAGQVPSHASVQRTGEVFWTGILEEPAVIEALKAV